MFHVCFNVFSFQNLIREKFDLHLVNLNSYSSLIALFFVPDLLKLKLPFLGGLKSSKVIVRPTSKGFAMTMRNSMLGKVSWRQFLKLMKAALETSPPMPDGIVDILLQNSLSAKVDIIDCSRQKEHSRF
uniref:Uncharacterized protein n=1 Tax=Lotus japonicus TaxID=34305 RepID=I3S7Y7_LOTJA|nr:unknown [Lotus japonicus]